MLEIKQLDLVMKDTIRAVEKGLDQIVSISEESKSQRDELLVKLIDLKSEIINVITEVDRLEIEEKQARIHLMEVSSDFSRYSEKDIQAAYEEAQAIQTRLGQLRERELQLRKRRDQMEAMLKKVNEIVARSDKLMNQVTMARDLLSGTFRGVTVRLEEMQLRQQLSLRIIKAQEEERLRVAREIHDGPAQSMANVVLRAEICEKLMEKEPEKVGDELKSLKAMVKESLQEVRKIIFDLRPMVLDDLGIVPTLKRYIAELRKRTDLSIELVVLGGEDERLPGTLEVAVFRIVQEGLNNIIKHARARRAVVRLEILPSQVRINISDDGIGFETSKAMTDINRDSFGLLGMKERVEILGGQMKVISAPGAGTDVIVTIPVKE